MNEAVGRETAQLAMKTMTLEILITDAAASLARLQQSEANIRQTCRLIKMRVNLFILLNCKGLWFPFHETAWLVLQLMLSGLD